MLSLNVTERDTPGRASRIPTELLAMLGPDVVLVDLDGTLLRGGDVVAGAFELLDAYNGRIAVVSNNSSDSPAQIARRLAQAGLPIPTRRVVTAGFALVDVVAIVAEPVLLIASPTVLRHARNSGMRLAVDERAGVVAIARTPTFGYETLTAAANALRDGARLVIANPDLCHPGKAGRLVPETGALVAAVRAAARYDGPMEVIGKPGRRLADIALARLGASAQSCVVVVGDNPATDGALAKAIGASFVPVDGVHA